MQRILIVLSFFLSFNGFSQSEDLPVKKNSPTIHLYGKIIDEKSEAVPFANVLLMRPQVDSLGVEKLILYKGAISENNGEFSFEELEWRKGLILQISTFGYDKLEMPLGERTGAVMDLGKLVLSTGSQDLDEVTVTAMEYSMRLDIDKKVFNVGQNTASEGGTAVDVMRNVPSVNVDIDGNVSMRNSSPQIFLDGRPTTLTLEQIPADAIESVEIITNPSSKYDASGEGGGGILNIVLKKEKKNGFNGNIRAGTSTYGAGNFGANINVRQNKINFNVGVNARLNNRLTTGTVDRTNYNNGIAEAILSQENEDRNNGGMMFGKFGIDYLVTNKLTLSLSGVKMFGNRGSISSQNYVTDSLFSGYSTQTFSERESESRRMMNNEGLVFGLKQLFKTEGEEFTFDANYFSGSSESFSDYTTTNTQSYSQVLRQKIEGAGADRNLILQTDYVKPFKNIKLETGLRAALRSRTTENYNYYFRDSIQDYELIYAPASNYKYTDQVYAAYASVSGRIKKIGYKVGLRAESSFYQGEIITVNESFSNQFPLSLFPTFFLSREMNKDQDIQFSYTRRISRPGFMQLIPFTDSTDLFNISRGNAALTPEFTQSAEISYMKRFNNKHNILASVYYRHTNNLITRYIYEDEGALINTYINANSSYNGGMEFTQQSTLAKWWEVTSNLNIYNSKVNFEDEANAAGTEALWSWFAKVNSNFRLPKDFSIQLSANYHSRTNKASGGGGGGHGGGGAQSSAQGYIDDYYSVDLAVKKAFFNKKLSLSVSMSDIFKTRYSTVYSRSDYFEQTYKRISNPREVRINLSYNFGKVDTVLFKRRTSGTGEDIEE